MAPSLLSRRSFVAGAALAAALPLRGVRGAARELRQFHNQTAESPLHRRLTELWATVAEETGGRIRVTTYALNDNIPGSDPEALQMLRTGELDFFTIMGGILGEVVPVAEAQGIPFAFGTNAQVYAAVDGSLGDLLRRECATQGMYAVRGGCFENGFRHITSATRPIRNIEDLQGLRLRTPNAAMFTDAFRSLGAEPVIINVAELYEGLASGRAEAQENPLIIAETFRLYEIQRYASLTNHMWSGFNLLSNLDLWNSLSADDQTIIETNTAKFVALQRADNTRINQELEAGLAGRGMVINTADTSGFRARLGDFYSRWQEHIGSEAWAILESYAGRLGA